MTTGSDLDRRITIERFVKVSDGYGGTIEQWIVLAIVAAARRDVSDSERFAYGGTVSVSLRRFIIRAIGPQATVNGDDRLLYDGMIWNILGVKETKEGRNRLLEITAEAEG